MNTTGVVLIRQVCRPLKNVCKVFGDRFWFRLQQLSQAAQLSLQLLVMIFQDLHSVANASLATDTNDSPPYLASSLVLCCRRALASASSISSLLLLVVPL